MKILLVDDDAFLRDMYAMKFTEAGDEVETAQDGGEALRKFSESKFDVVLLDMVMPGTTGIELIKQIQAKEGRKDQKCIVLSNQGEDDDVAEAMKAGAVGYIVKAEAIPSEVVSKVKEIIK